MNNTHQTVSLINKEQIPAEFYSQIINSLEDYAILTTDKELSINSWSSGATNIFQYEENEILGQHFKSIFTDEDIEEKIPLKEASIALSGGRATDERWHIRKDKSLFFASGLVFPMTDDAGDPIGFVKILRNVTEKQESEEAIKQYSHELEELNVHKDKTLSVLSHDLRTPLTSILGVAGWLKLQPDVANNQDINEMVGILHQSSKNMLVMLDNLLEWGRVKYASDIFSPEALNLKEFVRETINVNSEGADSKGIHLHGNIAQDLFVIADRNMLRSILQNLVSNAIKYTHVNGEIKILAERQEDQVFVSISDNGIGMSDNAREKLFIPQVELLSEPRVDNKGAGIGLLLVKEFLDKIGGDIRVDSKEGDGTTFTFTLPVA